MPDARQHAIAIRFLSFIFVTSGLLSAAAGITWARPQPTVQDDELEQSPTAKSPQKAEGESLVPPGGLPWEKSAGKRPPLPARRIESALRELLKIYGIDDSQLANFFHHQPLSVAEEEVLFRLLFRIPQFGMANIERWRTKDVTWTELAAEPDAYRAKIFPLAGRVTKVVRKPVLAEVAEVLEFDHYFQVSMELDAGHTALVCARSVPEAWKANVPLDERASCDGLFLKLGAAEEGKPQFVFVARSIAWHPQRSGALGVTDDLLWLGEQGVDIGSFDAPRARNQMPFGGSESECFYGLLSALGRTEPTELRERAKRSFDLGPLLQDAKSHHGDIVMFRGRARRVQRIVLGDDDRDFRERFGVDHYYQIDAFISLGDKHVQFSKGKGDPHGPVFTNTFLVTLCVLRVPPELTEGKSIDVGIRLPIVFYKIWEFPSDYVKKFGDWKMQPAPMLLGIEPEIVPEQTDNTSGLFSAGLGIVALLAFVGVWIGLWQYNRGDKQFKKKAAEIAAASRGEGKPPDFGKVIVREEPQKS